jgi:PEP-CTERM motif
MSTLLTRNAAGVMFAALSAIASAPALAQTTYWNLDKNCPTTNNTTTNGQYTNVIDGNTLLCKNSPQAGVSDTPVAATNGSANYAVVTAWGTENNTAGATFSAKKLLNHGNSYGLGVVNGDETTSGGQHATDNKDRTDAVLFEFDPSKPVTLDTITLGWRNKDSDLSVFAYTGVGSPMPLDIALGNPIGEGWTLVQHVNGACVTVTNGACTGSTSTDLNVDVNNGIPGVSSSWWLISAYNANYGACSPTCSTGDDFFKIASLSGSWTQRPTTQVSEPGSIALAGMALIGLVGVRRRQRAQKTA